MQHEYFGEFEIGADGFAGLPDQVIGGEAVSCELLQGDRPYSAGELDLFAAFCQSADGHVEKIYRFIRDNHDEVVGFAYEAWAEDEPELMKALFPDVAGPSDITAELTIARITPRSIWMSGPDEDGEDVTVNVDFSFKNVELDYVITGKFDLRGKLDLVTMES